MYGVRLKDEQLIKKQTEAYGLYSRVCWIFLPNVIKIDRYNFELYRFKVGAFFETQCIKLLYFFANHLAGQTLNWFSAKIFGFNRCRFVQGHTVCSRNGLLVCGIEHCAMLYVECCVVLCIELCAICWELCRVLCWALCHVVHWVLCHTLSTVPCCTLFLSPNIQ